MTTPQPAHPTSSRRRRRPTRWGAGLVLGVLVTTAAVGCRQGHRLVRATGVGIQDAPTTVHDATPTGLNPGLQAAVDRAIEDAGAIGLELTINSGYRTPERQQELLDEAIVEHGSRDAALRWVFTPERSMHVQGLAVDVGNGPAADWLDRTGATYGLCRTLDWEWWHFEWRPGWQRTQTCPDPAQDPAGAPGVDDGR